MRTALVCVVCVVIAVACFCAGRFSVEADDDEEEADAAASERAFVQQRKSPTHEPRVVVTRPSRLSPARDAPTTPPSAPAEAACREVVTFAQRCADHLKEREAELATIEDIRVEREGTLLQKRDNPEPRFAQAALTTAVQQAFPQTRVPGSVDGVDCSEHPCIVFGRINGAEDQMERLEKAPSLSAYQDDILTVLMWTTTDVPAKTEAAARGKDGAGLEQSLFAIALYPVADQRALGDNLDRRIRARTAELWNTMAPSDETAAK